MIRAEINQSRLKGGQRLPTRILEQVLKEIDKALKRKGERELSIAFVSKNTIRTLNRTYRGKDCVTDVLSFSLDDPVLLGDVLICYEQAKRQARDMKHSVRGEVVFLIVHGILHLHGYDHEKPKDLKKMFPLQTKILDRLGVDSRI